MNKIVRKLVDSFEAISENGKRVVIFVHQDIIKEEVWGDQGEYPTGRHFSSRGYTVTKEIDVNTYELFDGIKTITVTRCR